MKSQEIRSLNQNLASDRVSVPYPHVRVLEPSDAIALVMPSLPKGDFPVLCEYKGDLRKLGTVEFSAMALSVLLRLSKLSYVKSKDTKLTISNTIELMEAML